MVRSEELPAQWEKYPLSTQREMLAGRNSLIDGKLARWADEGEAWLRHRFYKSDLLFTTSWDTGARTITLHVRRRTKHVYPDGGLHSHWDQVVFDITEPAENFVSHLTVTKILMVM